MRRRELCICGRDITGNYMAHPPLAHFYQRQVNPWEPWSEYQGLADAALAVGEGYMPPLSMTSKEKS